MATKAEFASIMAYLCAGVGKRPEAETTKVYFDCLGDLPASILQDAARAAMVQHNYATLPPVAVVRQIATRLQQGERQLTAMEAIDAARKAINAAGGEYATADDRRAAYASLPATVADCLRSFGWDAFCQSESRETLQAQWRMNWDAVAKREQSERVLPEEIREKLNGKSVPRLETMFRRIEDAGGN